PLAEAVSRLLAAEPTPLGLVDADLRGPLEHIVARAMARDRTERYPSAAALADDLRAYISGRPVAPRHAPPGPPRPQLRGYRRAVVSATAALVAMAALAGWALVERGRSAQAAIELDRELGTNRIERGRLLAETGSLPAAESLVWPEFFRRPDDEYPRW